MTATVFNSPEPDVRPTPSAEPMMAGNPVLMRANGARRGPPVRTIASIAVLALAAAGVTAAVLHHRAAQIAQPASAEQLATQAAPAAPPIAQAASPVVEPGPAPATPQAAAPHRLASNQPVTEPLHRRVARSVGGAPSVDQSASDTSATAPLNGSAVYSPSASQNAANAAATVPAPTPAPVITAPVTPYAATPASPSPALQNPATIPQPPAPPTTQPSITTTPPESSPQ